MEDLIIHIKGRKTGRLAANVEAISKRISEGGSVFLPGIDKEKAIGFFGSEVNVEEVRWGAVNGLNNPALDEQLCGCLLTKAPS